MSKMLKRVLISITVFLAYILGFALIYAVGIPSDFRFADIETEENYKAAIRDLRQEYLDRGFDSEFRESLLKAYQKKLPDAEIDSIDVEIQVSERTNSKISFEGNVFLFDSSKGQELLDQRDGTIMLPITDCFIRKITNSRLDFRLGGWKQGVRLSCWVNDLLRVSGLSYDEGAEKYLRIMEAESRLDEGLFLRMFYFSSITATTLGYGDILPTSNTARLLVAIQSVFGLILMGILVVWTTSSRAGDTANEA